MSDAVDATTARVARILARPLFMPGRRPAPNDTAERTASVPPRLAGIIGTPGHLSAIFEFQPPTRGSVVVTQGAELDGWIVRSIAAHSVTLARDGAILVASPTPAGALNPVGGTDNKPPSFWQVGQRRGGPLPGYLQRRPPTALDD